jgi:endonuclease YncB( thermonuclease family)
MLPLKRFLPALMVCLTAPAAVHAQSAPAGQVACATPDRVHDGDSFRCINDGQTFSVRVAGIDAPETGQAFWRVARNSLREMVKNGSVVDCYKVDRYGRQVCRVSSPNGEDIPEQLVAIGLAWHTVKYRSEQTPEEQARYTAAEDFAREHRLGLWSQSDPQEPSKCRELKKLRMKCY